jgi:hypothetical protein
MAGIVSFCSVADMLTEPKRAGDARSSQEGNLSATGIAGAHEAPSADPIMRIAFGFAAAKTLFSAVELGVFRELAGGPASVEELRERLGLHPRSARDFLDTLVSLHILDRENGRYSNGPAAAEYLDPAKDGYLGGILEMFNRRLYTFWGSLTEALRTGEQQNEVKNGTDLFGALYSDPARLRGFLEAMTGISMPTAAALSRTFPWKDYRTFADIGTAQGRVPVQLAMEHAHLRGVGYDLPAVRPIFEEYVAKHGLQNRVRFHSGDFFTEPLASADVLIMGHILHDWGMEDKMRLLRKAYDALPAGGALIVYESLIDDQRRTNVQGLLMSLNMLIETPAGFDYTGADCQEWMRQTGFSSSRVEHLAGGESMVIGMK